MHASMTSASWCEADVPLVVVKSESALTGDKDGLFGIRTFWHMPSCEFDRGYQLSTSRDTFAIYRPSPNTQLPTQGEG